MMADQLYQEIVLSHYRHPHNKGALNQPTFAASDVNPACGDLIQIQARIGDDDRISEVTFDGKGCAISQAAASMLTDALKGKTIDEARAVDKEAVLRMLGIEISGIRLKCALLPLKAFKLGLYGYMGEALEESND